MNFKKLVYTLLHNVLSTNNDIDIESLIEVPANPEMGDYSFPCFKLAKIYRQYSFLQHSINNYTRRYFFG